MDTGTAETAVEQADWFKNRVFRRLAPLLGVAVLLVWVWRGEPGRPSFLSPISEPIVAEDINQHRLNTPLPIPQGTWRIEQGFVAGHDGLREIELMLVRYGDPAPEENGRFTIQLFDAQGSLVGEQDWATQTLRHNQVVTLHLPPQPDSAGRRYVLTLSGSADNPITAWGYDLNVLDGGELTLAPGPLTTDLPQTAVQELRFTTRYQLTDTAALQTLAQQLAQNGRLLLPALFFLPLPGCLLLLGTPLRRRRWDPLAWWGTALATGTAVWPLLWHAFTLLNGRWTGWLLWLVVFIGWLITLILWLRPRLPGILTSDQRSPYHLVTLSWEHILLLLLLLLGLALRLLAVRDVAVPLWVDAGRHALITAVMTESGQTIADYAPYLPVDHFPYHFGFHTLSSSLMLMREWPLPTLLLNLGQLLNALVPLTVYTAVWLMTRRRRAGLLAAFLVAAPFFFPAYYATWGRFTQLTAMLIMPVLLALTWQLCRGARRWRHAWWLVALLAAGLFLIHFRVFVFYLPWAAWVWLLSRGRNGRWLLLAGVSGLLLALPRILALLRVTNPAAQLSYNLPGYNAFPTGYYEAGWDRAFIWLAGAGLVLVLIGLVRRRRWTAVPLALALWVGSLFLALSGDYLGLPSTSLVNLNSMYITLFLPLAVFLALVVAQVGRWLERAHWLARWLSYSVAGFVLTAVLLFGVRQQITILNPETILVRPQDVDALRWLDQNLASEARLAVNSWLWLGNTWAGSDGGAWIVPLTGRQSSTPPVDYIYNRTLHDRVAAFNEAATAITDWSDPAQAEWLRQQGMTHVFVGARGGFFDPAELAQNPQMEMIYGRNGVFIFAIASTSENN